MEMHIGDSTYRVARKMNGMVQWDIFAKISPLLASGFGELLPLFVEMKSQGMHSLAEVDIAKLAAIATPVAREFSRTSDADRRYVFSTCLACVDRKKDNEQAWAKVWNTDANVSMFSDINNDAILMGRITLGVLQGTFQSFFPASLSALIDGGSA